MARPQIARRKESGSPASGGSPGPAAVRVARSVFRPWCLEQRDLKKLDAENRTKQAMAAARAGDCTRVTQAAPEIQALDQDIYTLLFARDVEIARCLGGP